MTRAVLDRAMTEDQLLLAVTDALTLYGWRWHHVRRSDKALQQGHAGFPDIIAVKGRQSLALELKRQGGRATPDQRAWLGALLGAGIEAWFVWPDDLDVLLERLAR